MDYEAQDAITAENLRRWMKANRYNEKVSVVDAREYPELRSIVADYGPGWEGSNELSWRVMRVDQLVNVYIRQD